MDEIKISPMEKRTLGALDNANPFAAAPTERVFGKAPAPQPQVTVINTPPPQPEPEPEAELIIEDTADEPEAPKRRGRKPKALADMPPVTLAQAEESFRNPIIASRSPEGLPSYRCEFEGRDIFVGHPWYKTTNPVTTHANIALALDFGRDKIRFDLHMGDAMIYHARNIIAEKFLATDAKWLLMMDDDMIPCIGRPNWYRYFVRSATQIGDNILGRHILHRLIGAGKTLVGGAYFGRQEGAPLMCSDRNLTAPARAYEDRIAAVDWVGTGCILIHRNVFRDIREKYPELASNVQGVPFDYFCPINASTGEDVSFCIRAKAAGHQAHIDLGTPIAHVGYKCY